MENNFISRVINVTALLAIIGCVVVYLYWDWLAAIGLGVGAVWGCLNLYFLKKLLEEYLKLNSKDALKCYTWIGIKFPLLYVIGYGLLKVFSIVSLVCGFSLIFIAIFLLGIGKLLSDKFQTNMGSHT